MEWAPTHANYALDKDLVEQVAKDGAVLVTWANFHYLDFTESWVAHVRELGRLVEERCPVVAMMRASGCALRIEWTLALDDQQPEQPPPRCKVRYGL